MGAMLSFVSEIGHSQIMPMNENNEGKERNMSELIGYLKLRVLSLILLFSAVYPAFKNFSGLVLITID